MKSLIAIKQYMISCAVLGTIRYVEIVTDCLIHGNSFMT